MLTAHDARGFARAAFRRLFPHHLRSYRVARPFIAGKSGLEVGGPSDQFFRYGRFPVYAEAAALDNCNFSRRTIWTGAIDAGRTFLYDRRRNPGMQYILEATDLAAIASESYDFVLASHTLEHVANPLKALGEWTRVLKPGGALVLVVPHKEGTFDHRRPVTTLAHLIDDERRSTPESDMTHLPEILALHDLSRDPAAGDFEAFKARCERGEENRTLHHHVFDTGLAVEVLDWMRLQILAVDLVRPYHIFLVARKTGPLEEVRNDAFLGDRAAFRHRSPFALDRHRGRSGAPRRP